MRSRLRLHAAALAALALLSFGGRLEADEDDTRRFLVIYGQNSVLPSTVATAAGLDRAFSRVGGLNLEVYTTFLDAERFPEDTHEARNAADLSARYAGRPLDAVVAFGPTAVSFALAHRDAFAPGTPLVYGSMTEETVSRLDLPDDVYGVVSAFDMARTLRLALALQPDAPRIVVISGSSDFDRTWTERARAQLGEAFEGTPVEHLSDLTLDQFAEAVSGLEPNAIVLFLTLFRDATGSPLVSLEALTVLADASAAPVYSVYDNAIGAGALGGHVDTFESIGEATGLLALAVAEDAAAAPQIVETSGAPTVDWRQVVRFGIEPDRLPDGTVRRFYEPSAWEQYRLEILGAAAVILLQTGTIVALLEQARRRRRLARELASGRLELAHASRAAQLGELSGALAHELNQPLGSILVNAEAGSRLLRSATPDLAEIADILSDIAADDRRAAGIITELRRLMTKGDAQLEVVELNGLVERTLALVRGELRARRTAVEFRPGAAAVSVLANAPQIQQVVLNLVLNAADAMADLAPDERRIVIRTAILPDGRRELRVADRGPGVTPEQAATAFRPFTTTKPNGLGLGLSICRSIAEAHGGTLAFDFESKAGAVAVLTLPAPPAGGADA